MAIDLSSIKKGPVNVPLRMVLAGTPGVGKTTFACAAPDPVVIQCEDGLDPLIQAGTVADTIARFPLATSYNDVKEALVTLYNEPHEYKTLVLDSLDWLEPFIWRAVCDDHGKKSIEEFGYGKGYIECDRYWQRFLAALNALRNDKGMHIILVAHTAVKKYESPDELGAYDRLTIKLEKRAAALVEEWSDVFAIAKPKSAIRSETTGTGTAAKTKYKAVGEVERIMYLADKPSAVAKNRYNLPPEMPLDWNTFAAAAKLS